jgi:hypothetical protein
MKTAFENQWISFIRNYRLLLLHAWISRESKLILEGYSIEDCCYMMIYICNLVSFSPLLPLIVNNRFTIRSKVTQVEHWPTVCRGRPCTRHTTVAESLSALLFSSVWLCMPLFLLRALHISSIWYPAIYNIVWIVRLWIVLITGKEAAHTEDSFSFSGSLFLTTSVWKDWECEGWA